MGKSRAESKRNGGEDLAGLLDRHWSGPCGIWTSALIRSLMRNPEKLLGVSFGAMAKKPWMGMPGEAEVEDEPKHILNLMKACLTLGTDAADIRASTAAAIAAGIGHGDRVAIWAPNSGTWLIAALGAQGAGAVLVPVNTRFKAGISTSPPEIGRVEPLADVGVARWLVTTRSRHSRLTASGQTNSIECKSWVV